MLACAVTTWTHHPFGGEQITMSARTSSPTFQATQLHTTLMLENCHISNRLANLRTTNVFCQWMLLANDLFPRQCPNPIHFGCLRKTARHHASEPAHWPNNFQNACAQRCGLSTACMESHQHQQQQCCVPTCLPTIKGTHLESGILHHDNVLPNKRLRLLQ